MTRNEENIQNAFDMFYKVMEILGNWEETELKRNLISLNTKHLLDNLDKALIQVNEEPVGETNNVQAV